MERMKKVLVALVCVAFLLSLVLSVFFVSHGSSHDCVGEECQICAVIHKCAELLRELLAVGTISAFFGVVFVSLCRIEEEFGESFLSVTPVRLKVKLSN